MLIRILHIRTLLLKAEMQNRRGKGLLQLAQRLRRQPQSWTHKSLLSPVDRAERYEYLKKISHMESEATKHIEEAEKMQLVSKSMLHEGRVLQPRLPLSTFICNNYRRKLAAAKHKAALLETMDLETMKNALNGKGGRDSHLSNYHMEVIKQALRTKEALASTESLVDVVQVRYEHNPTSCRRGTSELVLG